MAITKSGKLMVKKASFGTAILAHLAQNAYGRNALNYPGQLGLGKLFLRGLVKPEQGMSTVGGNLAYGAGKAIIPELEIMSNKFGDLGLAFRKQLAEHGLRFEDLSNRDIVALRRAMQGDFKKALGSRSPTAAAAVSSLMKTVAPESAVLFNKAKGAQSALRKDLLPEQVDQVLAGLSDVWKANRLTGNLGKYIGERGSHKATGIRGMLGRNKKGLAAKLMEASKGEDTAFRKGLRNTADAAVTGGLTVADPVTAAIGGVKRIADAKWFGKFRKGKEIQRNLGDAFVNIPTENALNKGLQGARSSQMEFSKVPGELADAYREGGVLGAAGKGWGYVKDTADAQVMNPFTNAVKNLATDVGNVFHRVGITPEHVQQLKNTGALSNGVPKEKTMYRKGYESYRKGVGAVQKARNSDLYGNILSSMFNIRL
ncbi:MAG: hypothetical protein IKO41_21615 [Lachnospiraceae bacterium]|nr:hypothetical protein [Lachnospiraceae bacterium]